MRYLTTVFLFFLCFQIQGQEQQVLFFQTDWGRQVSWDDYCSKAKASGYDGIEAWLPGKESDRKALSAALAKHGLKIIYLAGTHRGLPFDESLKNYKESLERIAELKPVAINSHTGSDFLSFEQNKAFIEAANKISKKSGIPIYHETHRGRFSFNLPDTRDYLASIPELRLTLDISHWMVVHESLLQGHDETLKPVIDQTGHIHARVGHSQGPQVNDPAAPEWKAAVDRHLGIWEQIIKKRWQEGQHTVTVTTEFGPPNYMPTLPYTQIPVSNQWKANTYIKQALKTRLNLK